MVIRKAKLILALAALAVSQSIVPATKAGKVQCEQILNTLLPYAEDMLVKMGSFKPFGAVITKTGKLQMSLPQLEPGRINDDVGSKRYLNVYKEQARQGDILAAGLVVLVEVKPLDKKKTTAIQISVEHLLGYAADVFYPYRMKAGKPVYGASFAGERERVIFPLKEKSNRPF